MLATGADAQASSGYVVTKNTTHVKRTHLPSYANGLQHTLADTGQQAIRIDLTEDTLNTRLAIESSPES